MPVGIDASRHPDTVVRVLLPLVAVVATVPAPLAGPALGSARPPEVLLAGSAVVLAGVGLTAVGAWRLLAAGARAVPAAGLLGAAVMLGEGVAIGGELAPDGAPGLLYGAAGGAVAGAGLLGVLVRWWRRSRPGAPAAPGLRRAVTAAVALLLALVVARGSVTAWLVTIGVVAVVVAGVPLLVRHVRAGTPRAALAIDPVVRPTRPAAVADPVADPVAEDDPYATIEVAPPDPAPEPAAPWNPTLRVLHLGGANPEDAAELHRRLAVAGHEVTVLGPRSPGAVDRIEHHGTGMVRWTHPVRRGWTRPGRLLAYVAAAVVAARHTRADLVVEELGAAPGPLGVPRWTTRPVVALAAVLPDPVPDGAWSPLLRLRWWAVRAHRSVVVPSAAGAETLAAARSRAHVAVIGDGIDPAALWIAPRHRDDDVVVRVGRLGLDPDLVRPLLDAWEATAVPSSGRLVLQGCGAAEPTLRGCAARLGLTRQVAFTEERDGEARHARVASARVAVVPPGAPDRASRAVALEALAVGTPVLGPDTAALREVVPPAVGLLVPPDAAPATIAAALGSLHADPARRRAAASQGPGLARAHDLDLLAGQTADVYLAAVTRGAMRRRGTVRV